MVDISNRVTEIRTKKDPSLFGMIRADFLDSSSGNNFCFLENMSYITIIEKTTHTKLPQITRQIKTNDYISKLRPLV